MSPDLNFRPLAFQAGGVCECLEYLSNVPSDTRNHHDDPSQPLLEPHLEDLNVRDTAYGLDEYSATFTIS